MAWSGGMAHGGPNNPWMKLMGIVHKERTARAAQSSSRHDGGDKETSNFDVTLDLTVYDLAMRCISCNLIPIPPYYTCLEGHLYCQPCGKETKKCIFPDLKELPCSKATSLNRSHVYEEVFKSAVFSCPWKKYGCEDKFTGKIIMEQDVVDNCPFKPAKFIPG